MSHKKITGASLRYLLVIYNNNKSIILFRTIKSEKKESFS